MPKPIPEEERAKIIDAIKEGHGCGEIARAFGRSKALVSGIAKEEGVEFCKRSQTKNATAVRKAYLSEQRLSLVDEGLAKLEVILPNIKKAKDMRFWAIALGTLIDKRRLEEPAPPPTENDGFMEALEKKVPEIWQGVEEQRAETNSIQMDSSEP